MLRRCSLGDEPVACIADAIANGDLDCLIELDLNENSISAEGGKLIFFAVQKAKMRKSFFGLKTFVWNGSELG